MTLIFADAYYWIALIDRADAGHRGARERSENLGSARLVTTDEVLGEVLTYFSRGPAMARMFAAETVRRVFDDRKVHVEPQTRAGFLSGLDLYWRRADKRYSLADCVSMQLMRRMGIESVLTRDRHFEQEGFQILFAPRQ